MTFVNARSQPATSAVHSYTIAPPPGLQPGHLMVLFASCDNTGGNSLTVSSTTGTWFLRDNRQAGASYTGMVWTKTAVAGESIVTITNTVNNVRGAAIIGAWNNETWRGITWFPATSGVAPTSGSVPAPTNTTAIALPGTRSGVDVAGQTWTIPTGWTPRGDADGFGNGGVTEAMATRKAAAGAVPSSVFTPPNISASGSAGVWIVLLDDNTQITAALPLTSGGGNQAIIGKKGARRALGTAMRTGNSAATAVGHAKGATVGLATVTGGGTPVFTGTTGVFNTFAEHGGDISTPWSGGKQTSANTVLSFDSSLTFTVSKEMAVALPTVTGGGTPVFTGVAAVQAPHTGSFTERGGGNQTFVAKKGARRALGVALTGGGTPAIGHAKAATSALPTVSGGDTVATWTATTSINNPPDTVNASFNERGGGNPVFAGFKKVTGSFLYQGGGDFAVNAPKHAVGGFVLRGGEDLAGGWSAVKTITFIPDVRGFFTVRGGGDAHINVGGAPAGQRLVQLVWNVSVDDHVRPTYHPLWKRFRYPDSRYALLLWRDGRVLETPTAAEALVLGADFVITGLWYGLESEWQAQVLLDAGYTMVEIPSISEVVTAP